jgi:hypothetical protein
VAPREVATAAAVGRVLAGDVMVAPRPRVALALRDGWAVNSALTHDAGPYAPAPLPSAIRIDAGEPLPAATDAVAELDAVVVRDGGPQAIAPITSGEACCRPARMRRPCWCGPSGGGRSGLRSRGAVTHPDARAAPAAVRTRRDPIIDAAAAATPRAAGGVARR